MARLSERTDAPETRDSPPRRGAVPTIVVLLVCLAGLTALVCTLLGSISVGLVAGLAVLVVALGLFAWIARHPRNAGPEDGSRRRFLQIGLGGVALVGAGAALGRVVEKGLRPDAIAVENAAADDLGAEYMELIARACRTPSAPATCSSCSRRSTPRTTRSNPSACTRAIRGRPTQRCGCTSSGSRSSPTGPGRDRARRQRGQGLARRPRAEHREPDRVRRVARRPGRKRAARTPDDRRDAQGGRHLRLRRRRLERPSPVAERLAEPPAIDA